MLYFRVVSVLAVMEQLDPDLGPLPFHPADRDIDRVGTRPGHQAHDQTRRLDAPLQKVGKWIGHPVFASSYHARTTGHDSIMCLRR